MKFLLAFIFLLISYTKVFYPDHFKAPTPEYLKEIKLEMTKKWPNNRTINLVFHGHSVPAGYFKTPIVNSLESYPIQVLNALKEKYPFAVINIINTSIGGENAISGEKRFKSDVLTHKPDVLFIDYALNDRRAGLTESKKAWDKMIKSALKNGIKIILLTPSPDLKVDLTEAENELELHSNQIIKLSKEYEVGLVDSYALFKEIQEKCDCLADYMSQGNHPNEKGHSVISSEIMKFF